MTAAISFRLEANIQDERTRRDLKLDSGISELLTKSVSDLNEQKKKCKMAMAAKKTALIKGAIFLVLLPLGIYFFYRASVEAEKIETAKHLFADARWEINSLVGRELRSTSADNSRVNIRHRDAVVDRLALWNGQTFICGCNVKDSVKEVFG